MKTDFTIRQAQQSDAVELKELFQNTVIVINRRDYSQVEVEDWASCGDDLSNIEEMIKTHYFIVAVNQQSQIVGFSSITPHGYLHSMFVHKDFQGKGIATMLLEEIERYAITAGIMRIRIFFVWLFCRSHKAHGVECPCPFGRKCRKFQKFPRQTFIFAGFCDPHTCPTPVGISLRCTHQPPASEIFLLRIA